MLSGAAMLAACAPAGGPQLGGDGNPATKVYRIGPGDAANVQFRLLDSVNALRAARGVGPVAYNAQLNAAAATHARDMSVQNRPWHFGSDGSSPLVRVQRVGYTGKLEGELISETYETELETLAAWMAQPDTRDVLMDPKISEIGFAWHQDPGGKLWYTVVTGSQI